MKLPQLPALISPKQPFKARFPERMIWTASSLKLFRSCKRKWFWKYILRLRERVKDKNLVIGGVFHECVAHWYRNPRSSMQRILIRYEKQLSAYLQAKGGFYSQEEVDKFDVAIKNFGGMMLAYEAQYSPIRKTWLIQSDLIEKQFLVPFEHFDYAGKIDLVVARKGHRRAVEHKTASRLRHGYIERLPLDTQCRGYMLGATQGLGIGIEEILYDVVAKSKWRRKSNESQDEFNLRNAERYMATPEKFFYQEPIPVTREAVASFVYELHHVQREYLHLRSELKGLDAREWEPNDDSCDKYFKQCEYLTLCLEGLDRGTARQYEQGDDLHQELNNEEE